MKSIGFAVALALCASLFTTANADIITEMQTDYTIGTPSNGWSYLWNPTGFAIGDAANYAALGATGNNYQDNTSVDAVGEGGGTGNFVSFDGGGDGDIDWILSGKSSNNSVDGNDHYAIARYTVQAGEAGVVTVDSAATFNFGGGGGTIAVYRNNVLTDSVTSAGGNSAFSLNAGTVAVNDTIDLAFLTPDSAAGTRNNRRFFVNTGVNLNRAAVPEPSSVALIGLGMLGLVARRRR